MQTNLQEQKDESLLEGLQCLCGNMEYLSWDMRPIVRQPFDSDICALLSSVSDRLMHDTEAKAYPDIITFAFFCRKANLSKLAEQYRDAIRGRLGRGIIFHIAPSNVPVNFAYTLIFGLLAGNICIVKASSKKFEQTRIISNAFQRELESEQFKDLGCYVNVVEYDRKRQDLTEYFSDICNIRVIWGGDETIRNVRMAQLKPRATEITFADRYSLALFSANAMIKLDEKKLKLLAQNFYNDTYLYDQNACTSPKLIYWVGNEGEVQRAQAIFWNAVYENIRNRYIIESVVAVDKYLAACRTAICSESTEISASQDNRIMRIQLKSLPQNLSNLTAPGGCFHEYIDTNMDALADVVDEKFQTLSYFGIEVNEIQQFVISHGLYGIDRIVPVGKTADIGLTWDGYDLIVGMSRTIFI